MKNYVRNYIGKGSQIQKMEIVKCTVKMEELLKFVHEYEGTDYVSFEVAKMKTEDKFGRTHTVYCTTTEEAVEEKPEPKKAKGKKKPEPAEADLPF